jgi:cell division septum initiation protein DivIVA
MERVPTHPSAEKLQVKFHNQNKDLENGKEAHRPDRQPNSKIQQDIADLKREFETQYEQFLNNISAARKSA